MPRKPQSRCTMCRRLHNGTGRCGQCRAAAAPSRAGSSLVTAAWKRIAHAAIDDHVATHGLICPGWGRPPHPVASAADFTADHIVARASGGTDDPSNVAVLCRPCNSAKRDRIAAPSGERCTLVVLCGIPSSGKTTWARTTGLAAWPDAVVLDDIPPAPGWVRLEQQRRRRAGALLSAGCSVIVDGCNFDERQRREWRRIGHINRADCVLVLVDIDLDRALALNAHRSRPTPVPPEVVGEYATRWQSVRAVAATERWHQVVAVSPAALPEG